MASDNSSDNWWSGWLKTAKEKSVDALQFVKSDLQEFTSTVQRDTVKAANTVKEKISQEEASTIVKQGVSSFLSSLNSEDNVRETESNDPVIFDQAQSRLSALQNDKRTYIDPVEDSDTEYEKFLDSFDIDVRKKDISDLMVNESAVRGLYTSLVPSQVPHTVFWQRYFYRLELLKKDEQRREELKRRADHTEEKDIAWDDEDEIDFCNDSVKLNEENSDKKILAHSQEKLDEIALKENQQGQFSNTNDNVLEKPTQSELDTVNDKKEKANSDSSLDDDWEVDIDVTEEDMKKAEEDLSNLKLKHEGKKSSTEKLDDKWENWE